MPLQRQLEADIWRCQACKALWMPMMAHEHLKDHADDVDVLEAGTAPDTEEPRQLMCPVCIAQPLIDMVDPQQPHIHFESCTECHGRLYDGGEFRDFAEETFRETLRTLRDEWNRE